MADYQMESLSAEINYEAARLARLLMNGPPARQPRYVAGVLGPFLPISPKLNDPAFRNVSFDQLVEAYRESTRALIEGGVDPDYD